MLFRIVFPGKNPHWRETAVWQRQIEAACQETFSPNVTTRLAGTETRDRPAPHTTLYFTFEENGPDLITFLERRNQLLALLDIPNARLALTWAGRRKTT